MDDSNNRLSLEFVCREQSRKGRCATRINKPTNDGVKIRTFDAQYMCFAMYAYRYIGAHLFPGLPTTYTSFSFRRLSSVCCVATYRTFNARTHASTYTLNIENLNEERISGEIYSYFIILYLCTQNFNICIVCVCAPCI